MAVGSEQTPTSYLESSLNANSMHLRTSNGDAAKQGRSTIPSALQLRGGGLNLRQRKPQQGGRRAEAFLLLFVGNDPWNVGWGSHCNDPWNVGWGSHFLWRGRRRRNAGGKRRRKWWTPFCCGWRRRRNAGGKSGRPRGLRREHRPATAVGAVESVFARAVIGARAAVVTVAIRREDAFVEADGRRKGRCRRRGRRRGRRRRRRRRRGRRGRRRRGGRTAHRPAAAVRAVGSVFTHVPLGARAAVVTHIIERVVAFVRADGRRGGR